MTCYISGFLLLTLSWLVSGISSGSTRCGGEPVTQFVKSNLVPKSYYDEVVKGKPYEEYEEDVWWREIFVPEQDFFQACREDRHCFGLFLSPLGNWFRLESRDVMVLLYSGWQSTSYQLYVPACISPEVQDMRELSGECLSEIWTLEEYNRAVPSSLYFALRQGLDINREEMSVVYNRYDIPLENRHCEQENQCIGMLWLRRSNMYTGYRLRESDLQQFVRDDNTLTDAVTYIPDCISPVVVDVHGPGNMLPIWKLVLIVVGGILTLIPLMLCGCRYILRMAIGPILADKCQEIALETIAHATAEEHAAFGVEHPQTTGEGDPALPSSAHNGEEADVEEQQHPPGGDEGLVSHKVHNVCTEEKVQEKEQPQTEGEATREAIVSKPLVKAEIACVLWGWGVRRLLLESRFTWMFICILNAVILLSLLALLSTDSPESYGYALWVALAAQSFVISLVTLIVPVKLSYLLSSMHARFEWMLSPKMS